MRNSTLSSTSQANIQLESGAGTKNSLMAFAYFKIKIIPK